MHKQQNRGGSVPFELFDIQIGLLLEFRSSKERQGGRFIVRCCEVISLVPLCESRRRHGELSYLSNKSRRGGVPVARARTRTHQARDT